MNDNQISPGTGQVNVALPPNYRFFVKKSGTGHTVLLQRKGLFGWRSIADDHIPEYCMSYPTLKLRMDRLIVDYLPSKYFHSEYEGYYPPKQIS